MKTVAIDEKVHERAKMHILIFKDKYTTLQELIDKSVTLTMDDDNDKKIMG